MIVMPVILIQRSVQTGNVFYIYTLQKLCPIAGFEQYRMHLTMNE